MSRRLQKLGEQRDLILKHLRWLEAEIASEEAPSTRRTPDPTPPPAEGNTEPVANPLTAPEIELDIRETRNVRSVRNQVRRGCLIYFLLAWLVLAAAVGGIYLAYGGRG